jgi:hypothetical protein
LDASRDFGRGLAVSGVDYAVRMPSWTLNGDGFKNFLPSSIVTDFWRPGNFELSLDRTLSTVGSAASNLWNGIGNIGSGIGSIGSTIGRGLVDFGNSVIHSFNTLNIDPLILDLNNDGVQLISYDQSKVLFDVDDDGFKEATAWVSAQDGILVWDLNGNGQIDDITETISEYFAGLGSTTVKDGLQALKTLDSNSDNKFDALDNAYNQLRVWRDGNTNTNRNRVTNKGDLKLAA